VKALADNENHPVADLGVGFVELKNWNETTRVVYTVRDQVLLALVRLILSLGKPKSFVIEFDLNKLQAWIYFLDEL